VVIAGCGFLGEAAAGLFLRAGWRVLGICASGESAGRLSAKGIEGFAADISQRFDVPGGWERPEVVIHSASSGRGGPDAYDRVYRAGMEELVAGFRPARVIFTGSTSVYGQASGVWVDEGSETFPPRETGEILLSAEKIALKAGGFVARLSGIYGPGRSVLLRKFLDRTATLEGGGDRWINQIHRDDGASALFHLATADAEAGVYNVCDNTPATQREVYRWIAACVGGSLPPDCPPEIGRKRGWTNKRVSNGKLRATGWAPRFPSYQDALPALVVQADSTHRA
jgi:nucleoside-diphosphate-sugar epimerase